MSLKHFQTKITNARAEKTKRTHLGVTSVITTRREENQRVIAKPSVTGSHLKRNIIIARARASGRSNPRFARSSRSNAELSPRRSRRATRRWLWGTKTNTYQTRPVYPWRTWSSCSTQSHALSPDIDTHSSSSVFVPRFDRSRFRFVHIRSRRVPSPFFIDAPGSGTVP